MTYAELVYHLKVDHGYTWVALRKMFPGRGQHFWEVVRSLVKERQEAF